MLRGATFSASEMTGTAVFRIVVSSDSMKNATATNHGNSRLLEAAGGVAGAAAPPERAGFNRLCPKVRGCRAMPSNAIWALGHAHQVVGAQPFLERRLHLGRLKVDIALGGQNRLIERQVQVAPMDEALCDIVDARLAERNSAQQQRLDAQQF